MPYFLYCIRCNQSGSYTEVNIDCPKCDGTGNDWRDDKELENYHKWSGLKLENLMLNKELESEDGTRFFYRDRIPTVKEERLELSLFLSEKEKLLTEPQKLTIKYDYYIEPCQRCIESSGETYDKCGWCHDSDTFYKERDVYLGDYIKIPYEGWGYPFHEIPHATRKYYIDDEYIEKSEGAIPSDVTDKDIAGAHARNNAVSGIQGLLKSGEKRTLDVKETHVNDFIDNMITITQESISSPPLLDVTGKTEFRFLAYTVSSLSMDVNTETKKIEEAITSGEEQLELLISDLKYKELCEVIAHEAFHILQAITTDSVGIRFDAQRRLSLLKWMLIEDFFLDRKGKVPFETDVFDLLLHLNKDSEIYHYISRNFDYCRSDSQLILNYSQNSQHFDLNMFDLIEGNAFVFQKYIVNNNIGINEFIDDKKISSVYLNALKYYVNHGGFDPVEFTLFCFVSLKIGLIVDEDDLINKPFSPVSLFGYICSLKKETPDFLQYDDFESINNFFEVRNLLEKMGYAINNSVIKYLENKNISDIRKFLVIALKYKKIHTEIFTFLRHVGLDESQYKNLKDLIECQQEARSGQANERLKAVKTNVTNELLITDSDIIIPFLLTFKHQALSILFKVNELTDNSEYTGAFGEEIVSTGSENTTIDIIERFSSCMRKDKEIFCCNKHGFVSNMQKIDSCNQPGGLNNIISSRFERELLDMIGADKITYTEI